MAAGRFDLALEGGQDTPVTFTWQSNGAPVNLTGYTAKLQIRQYPNGTLVLQKATSDGSITLGGANGTISFTVSVANAATLYSAIQQGRQLKYDLIMTSPGNVYTKLLKGYVTVDPAITV
jgi:hypothetical protein